MRSVLIGTVQFSRACLDHLISRGIAPVGVVTRPGSTYNSDYASLIEPCRAADIPVHLTRDVNTEETIAWVQAQKPDVIFCFGWSQILSAEIRGTASLGAVGYHPALLPKNRGRHPIVWALVLGLDKTGSTFFLMDDGVDSGDILSQRQIAIAPDDDAQTLYTKLTGVALSQLDEFLPLLSAGTIKRLKQNHSGATVWRKRTPLDGRIDWRMPASGIHNLVRALTKPYPGATVMWRDQECLVWRTALVSEGMAADVEPGRVLAVTGAVVRVKAGIGAIDLIEHELSPLPEAGGFL
jgi:methionyl-tRNA formyltransferase